MSKFLTPPVWYDSEGNLVEILTGHISSYDGTVSYTGSMAIGKNASVEGNYSVAVGESTIIYNGSTTAIGYNTVSRGNGNIVIGYKAESYYVSNSESGNIVIGENSSVIGGGSIAIGKNNTVIGNGSIAIGSGITFGTAENPVNYTIQIGSSDKGYNFKVGSRDVFAEIYAAKSAANTAAGTFFIGTTKYKATYDSDSYTLNFVPANT